MDEKVNYRKLDQKEICKDLLLQGIKARQYCYMDMTGKEWKWQGELYDKYVEGMKSATTALEVMTENQIEKIENNEVVLLANPETMKDERFHLMDLHIEEDNLATYPYKRQWVRALLIRAISLVCGIGIAYYCPISFK